MVFFFYVCLFVGVFVYVCLGIFVWGLFGFFFSSLKLLLRGSSN